MSSEKDFIIFSPVSLTAMAPIIDENIRGNYTKALCQIRTIAAFFCGIGPYLLNKILKFPEFSLLICYQGHQRSFAVFIANLWLLSEKFIKAYFIGIFFEHLLKYRHRL
jgi:hypothetical protein